VRKPRSGNRRKDPNRCRNGHDLTLPDATSQDDGWTRCRMCARERMRKMRSRRRKAGRKPHEAMRPRGPSEPQMTPAEIEAHFQRMRWEENNARPWEKSRRMWGNEADRHNRMR